MSKQDEYAPPRIGEPFVCIDCGTEFDYPPISSRYEQRGEAPTDYPVKTGDLCNNCARVGEGGG